MKKPDFVKYDLVADTNNSSKKAVVVKAPYEKGGLWFKVVSERMFGRYDRFFWDHKEVNANDYVLISRGLTGRLRFMKLSRPALITAIILALILILGLWLSGNYNSLVTASNGVDNSWSRVETQYQRRLDLIDNIVSSVKGSQLQEQKVFKDIADGRKQYSAAQQSGDENGQAQAASNIETNVALIPRLQEAYPELRSNEQVTRLIGELQGTENGILEVRNRYNDAVTNYNTNITRFPKNMFAGLFDFEKRTLFKADTQAATAPKINFGQ